MIRILVGTPTVMKYAPFLESLSSFLYDASKKYSIVHRYVHNKTIEQAYTELTDYAVNNDFDYFLAIEDDMHGFNIDMLDTLIDHPSMVTSVACYSRHYPYWLTSMNMVKEGSDDSIETLSKYTEAIYDSGFHEVDLTHFAFTLFNVDIFRKLSKPWVNATLAQSNAVDRFFFKKMKSELGLKPYCCYDHYINHREITKVNVHNKRSEFIKENPYRYFGRSRLNGSKVG